MALTKHYRFIDWITQLHLAIVGLLTLLFHSGHVRHWPWLVAAHALGMILVHSLVQAHAARRGGPVVTFLRGFYPILFYTGFYRETGELNQMFVTGYRDAWFIQMDQALFGCQPSLTFMDHWPQWFVSEFFYACYFSYYLMIAGIGLALLLRNRDQFFHFVSVVSFVFYLCYLTYIFLPVMGPRIFFGARADLFFGSSHVLSLPAELMPSPPPEFPLSVQAGLFFQLVIWIYRYFEAAGAAFPSSHVSVALTTLYFSWIYLPRIRWIHAFVAAGLCLATVYCRYHYVVDVFAGMAVAATLVPIGNRLFRYFERSGSASCSS